MLLDRDPGAEERLQPLTDYFNSRLDEGHGEALFDLGEEENGESMGFDKDDWDYAMTRVQAALKPLEADYKILMTRNVGGDEEVESTKAIMQSKEEDKPKNEANDLDEAKEKGKTKGKGKTKKDRLERVKPVSSGKLLLRRKAPTVNEVIETRIAVVGNGTALNAECVEGMLTSQQSTLENQLCSVF